MLALCAASAFVCWCRHDRHYRVGSPLVGAYLECHREVAELMIVVLILGFVAVLLYLDHIIGLLMERQR